MASMWEPAFGPKCPKINEWVNKWVSTDLVAQASDPHTADNSQGTKHQDSISLITPSITEELDIHFHILTLSISIYTRVLPCFQGRLPPSYFNPSFVWYTHKYSQHVCSKFSDVWWPVPSLTFKGYFSHFYITKLPFISIVALLCYRTSPQKVQHTSTNPRQGSHDRPKYRHHQSPAWWVWVRGHLQEQVSLKDSCITKAHTTMGDCLSQGYYCYDETAWSARQ